MLMGYKIAANTHRLMLQKEELTEEERKDFERKVRIYDFLADCEDTDIPLLFDAGAFNEIAIRYAKTAMRQAGISEEDRDLAVAEMRRLFSDYGAMDI